MRKAYDYCAATDEDGDGLMDNTKAGLAAVETGTLRRRDVLTLGLVSNWLAASLLAFTIFFYAVIYTMWLKRWTPQNIVIGGAAGALPPVVACAAVTGSVSLASLVLFAIIFIWTPPHFWALAIGKAEDYGRAGIPMMPSAQDGCAGERPSGVTPLPSDSA
jgi:protoheme IX farnesyltransferase